MGASPDEGERRRGKRLRLEKDIFGDEYLGARRVLRLSLDEARLPEGALRLIEALQLMEKEGSDLSRAFSEALESVEPNFWKRKLEELTPLEWKLLRALEDESFREQVKDILG